MRRTIRILATCSALALSTAAWGQEAAGSETQLLREEVRQLREELQALKTQLGGMAAKPPLRQPDAPLAAAAITNSGRAFGKSFDEIFDDPNEFLAAPDAAPGSNSKTTSESRSLAGNLARQAAARAGSLLFDRPVDRRASGVSVELGSADTRVSLQFVRSTAGKFLEQGNPRLGDAPYLNSWTFGVSARADGANSIFKGGEDGGLLDDLKAAIGFKRTFYRRRSWPDMIDDVAKAQAEAEKACRKAKWGAEAYPDAEKLLSGCTDAELHRWVLAGKKGGRYENSASQEALTKAVWGNIQPVFDIGIDLELGRRAFTFRHLASLDPGDIDPTQPFSRAERERTRWPYRASAHVGRFVTFGSGTEPQLYGALLTELGREYEYAKSDKDQVVCPLVPTAPTFVKCSKLNVAPPGRESFWRLGLQGKALVAGWPSVPRIGIAPKVTYDVRDEQFALDVPVTFIESSDGKLSGGIRFKKEWEGTNPDPFSVGVFFGTAFKVGR